ncbi:hypothetical protein BLNAU_13152 [Blattamonas nauphoetae]|uniref:Uncharacterized protein n=1 Tax=Blattamonas nauphoetae TaxID=2049346 RepID=A0ABQ9XL33_9EUKA|nr:hypothetical protein BLNAU_13152 [Blattamonas nauphoetae]
MEAMRNPARSLRSVFPQAAMLGLFAARDRLSPTQRAKGHIVNANQTGPNITQQQSDHPRGGHATLTVIRDITSKLL